MKLRDLLNALPPAFCRYVARTKNGWRGLTTSELEAMSGLSPTTIKELSYRVSWDNVTIGVATKFMEACGVNPLAARAQRQFVKRRKMIHIDRAIGAQKKMYQKIETILIEEAKRRTKQNL